MVYVLTHIEHHHNHSESNILTTQQVSRLTPLAEFCPAFSGSNPNDWLSPTDIFLSAHGIGQCGALAFALPHSLVKLKHLT